MAEKAASSLSPREALDTIARTASFEEPLRRRVEGVTWMVWGFVTAGVALSVGAVELAFGFPAPAWVEMAYPWLWLLAGIAGTTAVWRIAALARPEAHPGRRAALVAIAVVVGSIIAIQVAIGLLAAEQNQSAYILPTIAVPWLALALVNPHRVSPVGRRVMIAIGAATAVAGVAWAPFVGALPHSGFPETMLLTALVGGGIPLVLGFWQALRG